MTPAIVVFAYLGIVLYIGIFAFRRGKTSGEDYFLASRSLGQYIFLFALFGTNMTAFSILGASGLAYHRGIGVFGMLASASAFVIPLSIFFIGTRLWGLGKKFGYMTQVQYLRDRWECVLRPRGLSTLSGNLAVTGPMSVDVTPRRLQSFLVSNRTDYLYTVYNAAGGEMLASGVAQADAGYVLTVANVPVVAEGSRLVLRPVSSLAVENAAAPRVPRLAMAANPVRDATVLNVDWPSDGLARIDLVDLAGRHARTLFSGPARGSVSLSLDARGLAPGVYLVHARQAGLQSSKRVIVVR